MAHTASSVSPYLLRPLRALEQVLGGRGGVVQPRPEWAKWRQPFNSRDERAKATTDAHARQSTERSWEHLQP
jgi:hypothetical protein